MPSRVHLVRACILISAALITATLAVAVWTGHVATGVLVWCSLSLAAGLVYLRNR